jgi:hypothetical protein
MGSFFVVLAATTFLQGGLPIHGTLDQVIDAGTLLIDTRAGKVIVRVTGMKCPGPPEKCADPRPGSLCAAQNKHKWDAIYRAQRLLTGYNLLLTPCGTYTHDKDGRTFAMVSVDETKIYMAKMTLEGWCTRLDTACTIPDK